ncbi:hypothetical protein FRC08_003183 [Ceratobasidium sp. 394]|nr:hypothetical protein FRC08_003183 [Ceratobasidium sp. 394]
MFYCTVKALDDAQAQLLEQEEENERLQAEIEALRARNAPPEAENKEEDEPAATNVQVALPYSEAEGKAVRTAGRRRCVLHMPWMCGDSPFDTDVWNSFGAIISELKELRGEEHDGEGEADNAAT